MIDVALVSACLRKFPEKVESGKDSHLSNYRPNFSHICRKLFNLGVIKLKNFTAKSRGY